MTLAPGMHARLLIMVEGGDTAAKVGSGDVPVLATPRVLALAERATVEAISGALEPGQTSVGTKVTLEHLAASPVGAHVEIIAELVAVEGRRLSFTFTARDHDTVVARGTVERVVVDRERFLANLTR
ncbi:hotdog domain-containing protein [Streptosporangium sp. NPDC051023]|uniref:thioesterase family protein n=1 Tax=Streptosporangium sp. NPDC051023 TaxID=3155410 RepID=UPI003450EA77